MFTRIKLLPVLKAKHRLTLSKHSTPWGRIKRGNRYKVKIIFIRKNVFFVNQLFVEIPCWSDCLNLNLIAKCIFLQMTNIHRDPFGQPKDPSWIRLAQYLQTSLESGQLSQIVTFVPHSKIQLREPKFSSIQYSFIEKCLCMVQLSSISSMR